MTDSARDNLTDCNNLAESTPQVPAVRDFTADDLDPAYGSHGSNPHGVHYNSDQKAERFATFIHAIETGSSLRSALRTAGISWATVGRWLAGNEAMSAQYERARAQSSDVWADRAVYHAMKATNKDNAHAAKVKSDVAKWRAAVQSPRWSERQDTNIAVQVNVTTNQVMMDQLRRRNLSDG